MCAPSGLKASSGSSVVCGKNVLASHSDRRNQETVVKLSAFSFPLSAFSFPLSAFSVQLSALLRLKSLGSPADCLLHPKSHRPGGPAILIGGHYACWGWGYSEISNLELLCSFGPLPCHSRPLLAPDAWHLSPGTRNLDPVLLPHLLPTAYDLPDPWHLTPGT